MNMSEQQLRNHVRQNEIIVDTIVKRPRGSWKWQDAYAVSTYKAVVSITGNVVWKLVKQTEKLSMPQLEKSHPELNRFGRPSHNDIMAVVGG